ncbi:MAG: hypothetical protein AAB380_02240 [Verrucomicrobiota bacterium]
MKKIILTLTIVALAVAVQAGEGKTCSKDKAACAAKDKAACAAKAESGCCAKAASTAKETCPKSQATKKALMSPKAAGEAASK